ncbi:MAG: hypothetical protein JST22_04410 [Bacteroidetes bacterium]|nr:hypothetical protein [Bacteroidota bacterium]
MNNELLSPATPEDANALPAVITATLNVSNFMIPPGSSFSTETVMAHPLSTGEPITFQLDTFNGSAAVAEEPLENSNFIGRTRATLPAWSGPGSVFTIAYTQAFDIPAGRPQIVLQVDAGGESLAAPPTQGAYATLFIEGFDPTLDFPITVTLYHSTVLGLTTVDTVVVKNNGQWFVNSTDATSPLIAIDVTPARTTTDPFEVNTVGAGTQVFPDGPIRKRIRVLLTQAVIDPPY